MADIIGNKIKIERILAKRELNELISHHANVQK
jgi:hypothetical protein